MGGGIKSLSFPLNRQGCIVKFMSIPIVGPVAPYTNPPINPQFYQPSRFTVSNITLGQTTTVTTTVDVNYVVGQLCRLIIPTTSGCRQLNEASGYVLSLPATNQVQLAINSVGGSAFTASSAANQPQILAIGDINSGQNNINGPGTEITFIPGSFINISPN